jgi:hypothetical protein
MGGMEHRRAAHVIVALALVAARVRVNVARFDLAGLVPLLTGHQFCPRAVENAVQLGAAHGADTTEPIFGLARTSTV